MNVRVVVYRVGEVKDIRGETGERRGAVTVIERGTGGRVLTGALRNWLDGNPGGVVPDVDVTVPAPPPLAVGGAPRRTRGRTVYIPGREALMRDEYVAVDFETANRVGGASACQVALVKVRGGEVAATLTTYLRPPEDHIRFEFSHIHGIYRGDVQDAPSWFDIADEVHEFVGELPVWAHNATFDASVWRGLDRYYATGTFPTEFYCTCRTARRLLPQLPDHTLPTVTAYCAPGFTLEHHRADSDALACAHIVALFQRASSLNLMLDGGGRR